MKRTRNNLLYKMILTSPKDLSTSLPDMVLHRSCEPNNQLNICTTSVTEGEVVHVKLV